MYIFKRIEGESDWNTLKALVEESPRTSFILHPDWLEGYAIVPFLLKKTGYLLFDSNGSPLAGIAGIRYWNGRWVYVFPSDPVTVNRDDNSKSVLLTRIREAVRGRIHISSSLEGLDELGFREGTFPKWIYANPGIGSVSILPTEESQMADFKYQVRRNVKRSIDQGLELERVSSMDRLRDFYDICKMNADQEGYRIKPFFFYRRMWVRGLENGSFHFLLAKHKDRTKGGMWLIRSGRMLHNIMGGSVKEKPRLEVGYFLQWSAIRLSIEMGFSEYNISVGGPKGVEAFKDDFGRVIHGKTKTYSSD